MENESDWHLNSFEQILELLQSVNATEILICGCHIFTPILLTRPADPMWVDEYVPRREVIVR